MNVQSSISNNSEINYKNSKRCATLCYYFKVYNCKAFILNTNTFENIFLQFTDWWSHYIITMGIVIIITIVKTLIIKLWLWNQYNVHYWYKCPQFQQLHIHSPWNHELFTDFQMKMNTYRYSTFLFSLFFSFFCNTYIVVVENCNKQSIYTVLSRNTSHR